MAFADRPLVQFAAYVAGASIVLIALVWIAASEDIRFPAWLPDEGTLYFSLLGIVVFVASRAVRLTSWTGVFYATLIAMSLGIGFYFGPLLFLLPYPMASMLAFVIPLALVLFMVYGAIILAATWLRLGHRPGGTT